MGKMELGAQVAPGQAQFGDLLLGAGTPYRWTSLRGWEELPALDSSTAPRPDDHGAFPGALLAQARTIGLDLIVRAPRDQIGGTVAALNAATAPTAVEAPLVIWLDDRGPLVVYARAVRRIVPVANGYQLGTILGAAVEWEASDPRRYGVDEQSVETGLPAAEPGLEWAGETGLEWADGLDWGIGGATGNVGAVNGGDAPTHPVITFTGPVTMPRLSQEDGRMIEYDITLAPADRLVVDTRAGTVTLNDSASRLYTATSRSVPEGAFTLAPGTTSLAFRAESHTPDAHCAITWRSAHW
ncbi:minor tail protein [Streptomyces phage Picard]|uniref:Minor tail protein n=1 Tax=Streptomyces phage Picard TaxID=1920311 RepID=A0A1J0MC75_9CAUD|nr:minor tail protein [Streptomyces phage Picard]APD18548.1 minor tail protein [Streptomyces phage Picard]